MEGSAVNGILWIMLAVRVVPKLLCVYRVIVVVVGPGLTWLVPADLRHRIVNTPIVKRSLIRIHFVQVSPGN